MYMIVSDAGLLRKLQFCKLSLIEQCIKTFHHQNPCKLKSASGKENGVVLNPSQTIYTTPWKQHPDSCIQTFIGSSTCLHVADHSSYQCRSRTGQLGHEVGENRYEVNHAARQTEWPDFDVCPQRHAAELRTHHRYLCEEASTKNAVPEPAFSSK